ncbi:MAG: type II toxin-antitoxin system HicB family antitoxin [Terriglobia bacterium]|jgi:predicted RNase H-like HicB family nuclease
MKDLRDYLALPYSIEITPDEGGYTAEIPDLPGCMSFGDTINAALRGLEEVKELWFEGRIEAGEEVPEPSKVEDFSGKFVLRIPRSLHRTLDHEARKQRVSLNQYVLHILSERHHLGTLQSKLELALDQLTVRRGWKLSDWSGLGPSAGVRIKLRTTRARTGRENQRMLDAIPRPPKSYRGSQPVRECGESAHVHR